MWILRQYEKEGYSIVEYTKDGKTVSHTVKTLIPAEPIEPEQPELTQEQIQLQTLLNTEFLVIMSEISGL